MSYPGPSILFIVGFANPSSEGDGAENCGSYSAKASKDQQAQTSFDEILSDYSKTIKNTSAISPLNAQYITYVVLGTKDLPIDTLSGGPIEPLSIVAVVCDNKLFYGVFGDTNGEDDDNYTGEASYSLANMCFPKEGLNGDNGHTGHDVLYIAFPGKEAVPGAAGAGWDAKNAQQFQETLKPLGDQLVEKAFNTETMDNWRSIKSEIPSGGVWSTGEPRTWRSILGFVGIGWILRFM